MKLCTFNFVFKIFILFIILLIIEGIFHNYYYKFSHHLSFLEYKMLAGPNPDIWNENGIVEILQFIFLFFSVIFFSIYYYNFKKNHSIKFLNYILVLYLFGMIYFLLEEISWGQHIFGWKTLPFFKEVNTQNENNFHNTSNLLNELPRSLLTLWCSLGFLFYKSLKKFKGIPSDFLEFILPNKNLINISILLIGVLVPDLIIDKFNFHPGAPILNSQIYVVDTIAPHEIFDLISLNFLRLSELHELIFSFYILVHSFYLIKINNLKN